MLRVKEALGNGVYLLEGSDGGTIKENQVNLAACHWLVPSGSFGTRLRRAPLASRAPRVARDR